MYVYKYTYTSFLYAPPPSVRYIVISVKTGSLVEIISTFKKWKFFDTQSYTYKQQHICNVVNETRFILIWVYVSIHIYIYIYIYIYIHMCIHTFLFEEGGLSWRRSTVRSVRVLKTYICICIYVNVYLCIYIHTYIYIYIS
jgi:hypothetical protein